jgi:MFS family permease
MLLVLGNRTGTNNSYLEGKHIFFMSEAVASRKPAPLLTNRNFMLLWIGQSLSLIGDYFFAATIVLWMIEKLAKGASWLPLVTGGLTMSAMLPSLLLGPIAGVLVDRWNRRWTMIWTDIVRFLLIILFLLMTLIASDRILLMISSFVILLLIGCGSQFFLPARVAIVAELIPQEQHPQAYGMLQQAGYFAQIAGPTVAAPLYIALGPTWAISLNAFSFLVSFLVILPIRVSSLERSETPEQTNFWQDLREGGRFFVGNRVLVPLTVTGMIFMFGGAAYNAIQYLYGSENLHIPAQLLGLYIGCYGVGVVIGLPITVPLAKRMSPVELLWISLIVSGIAVLALACQTIMLPGIVCSLLDGISSAGIALAVRPLTVLVTPRELIGRVMAFTTFTITIVSLAGASLASILASTVLLSLHTHIAGITLDHLNTILMGIGALTVAAGVFARLVLYPAVKAYQRG